MGDVTIGVVGAAGRMGRMLVKEIAETEGAALAGATEGKGNPALGQDAGELAGVGSLGIALGDDPAELFAVAGAVIDFTLTPSDDCPFSPGGAGARAFDHRHHGLYARSGSGAGEGHAPYSDRLGAEYEPRRQSAFRADRTGRGRAR